MEPAASPSTSTPGPASTRADRSLRRRMIVRALFLTFALVSLYVLWPSLLKVLSAWPELLRIEPGWFAVMFAVEIASLSLIHI